VALFEININLRLPPEFFADLNTIKERIAAMTQEITDLKQAVADVKAAVEQFPAAIDAFEARITALLASSGMSEADKAELAAATTDLRSALTTATTALADAGDGIDEAATPQGRVGRPGGAREDVRRQQGRVGRAGRSRPSGALARKGLPPAARAGVAAACGDGARANPPRPATRRRSMRPVAERCLRESRACSPTHCRARASIDASPRPRRATTRELARVLRRPLRCPGGPQGRAGARR
jgi:hypothetical protein